MHQSFIKILLVEDEPGDREFLQEIVHEIKEVSFDIVWADRLMSGLAYLTSHSFDIILLDLSLPDSQGLDTFVKMYEQTPEIPIVLLTGLDDEFIAIQALQKGAQDYLNKGKLTGELLRRTIRYAIERQRLMTALEKRAQELQTNEIRFRHMIEKNADGILIVDRHGLVRFANTAAESLLGRPVSELVGTVFGFPLLGEKITEIEIIRQNREFAIVEIQVTEIVWEEEPAYLASLRDITTHKETEKALQQAHDELERRVAERTAYLQRVNALLHEEILERQRVNEVLSALNTQVRQRHREIEQLLAAISSILVSIDAQDRITEWNRKAEIIFGLPHNVVHRQSIHTCSIPWDSTAVLAALATCRSTGQSLRLDEVRFTRLDGTEGLLGLSINPVKGEDSSWVGALILGQDITERKLLENQLAQAQKLEAIGQLAAGIAHEINTPTQYVNDNMHFLQDAFRDLQTLLEHYAVLYQAIKAGRATSDLLEEVEAFSEKIELSYLCTEIPLAIQQSLEGLQRVTQIVRAMKEFSHPGDKEKIAIDLNKTIESTITVARNEWKYIAEIVTDFDPTLTAVPCLPGDINQVILNIIINAAHAIAEVVGNGEHNKGTITIRTRQVGKWAEIRISDTGTGIPEPIRDKIFNPFFTTKEVGKGTGQGLALAHTAIVEKHAGTITFDTEVGKGTTFIIRLPLQPPMVEEDIRRC